MSPRTHVNLLCGLENRHNPRTSASSRWGKKDWWFREIIALDYKDFTVLNVYFLCRQDLWKLNSCGSRNYEKLFNSSSLGRLEREVRHHTWHFVYNSCCLVKQAIRLRPWANNNTITVAQGLRQIVHFNNSPTYFNTEGQLQIVATLRSILCSYMVRNEKSSLDTECNLTNFLSPFCSHLNDELNEFCDNHSLDQEPRGESCWPVWP